MKGLVKLFDANGEDGMDTSANAKDAKDAGAAARHGNANSSAFEAPQRDTNHMAMTAASNMV